MSPIERIRNRLAKLERQKGYIYGMAMAEYAHAAGISEKDALLDAFGSFDGKDCTLIRKGYRSQMCAILKRLERAEWDRFDLFTDLPGGLSAF